MTKGRGRALLLSAAMVLSIVVGPVALTGAGAAQSTLVVDAGGSGDYTTIQAAIDNATAGDTIEVRAGDYAGFLVDKRVTIEATGAAVVRGEQDGQVVIRADGTELVGLQFAGDYSDWIANPYQPQQFGPQKDPGSVYWGVVYVNASDVRIDGIEVSLDQYNSGVNGMVIAGDAVVTNSSFLAPNGFHGGPILEITAGSDVSITGNTFKRNIGGFVGADQQVTVRDNTFNGTKRDFGFQGPNGGAIPESATLDIGNNGMAYVLPDSSNGGVVSWVGDRQVFASASVASVLSVTKPGGTAHVDAGTFQTGGLTIASNVTLAGAGAEQTTLEHTGTVVELASTDVTIRDLTVANGSDGIHVATGQDASGFRLLDAALVGNRIGLYVDGDTIHNTGVADNAAFDDVLLRDVSVRDSGRKGLYVEKLSNATFERLHVDGVTSPTYGFNDGIDLNVKDGDYANVTIRDAIVEDVAAGTPNAGVDSFAAAVAIKARDDGAYAAAPATLTGVTLDNVTVRNSHNGLRFGEPGSPNAGPTNVTLRDSTFANNTGYHLQLATDGLALGAAGFTETGTSYDRHVVVYENSTARTPQTVWSDLGDAMATVGAGDVLVATGGTYDETLRFPAEDVTLVGREGATIAPSTLSHGDRVVDTYGHANATVRGFTVVGQSNTLSPVNVGVTVNGLNGTVEDLVVRHVTTGVQTSRVGSDGATISNVTALDVGVGVSTQGNATVTDSRVEDAWIAGAGVLSGTTATLARNGFRNVSGPAVSISDYPGFETTDGHVLLRRNDLSGGRDGLDNAAGVLDVDARENYWGALSGPGGGHGGFGVPAPANVSVEPYYVDRPMTTLSTNVTATADVVVDDDGPADFTTISAGVSAASPGDEVLVGPGTYDEDVTVAKNLTLTGYGATIDGRVDLQTDGITFEGFTVTNATPAPRVDGIRISVDADTAAVITVRDVTVRGLSNKSTTQAVEGIHVFAANRIDGVRIENVTISDVSQPAWGADGVKIQAGAANVSIVNSTIRDVHGRWAYGVVATPSSDLSLGVPTAVRVEGTSISAISSELANAGVAVGVDSASGASTATGVTPADGVAVHNSSFVDVDYGVYNKDTGNVTDATSNYWGAANGPSGGVTGPDGSVADGDGVAVSANVAFVPYLTSPGGGPADLALNRTALAFGSVPATPDGSSSSTLALRVTSTGDQALSLSAFDVVGSGAGQFEITGGGADGTLAPFESRVVTVAFAPTARGDASATLQFSTNVPGQATVSVPLSGTGRAPRVEVTTTEPVQFSAAVGGTADRTVAVRNGGNAPLSLNATTGSPFSVTSAPPSTLAPGASASVGVRFSPSAGGLVSGTLTLSSNDSFTPTRTVRLGGRAQAPSVETSVPDGDTIAFGTVPVDETTAIDVIVTNDGTATLTLDSVSATGDFDATAQSTSLAPGASTRVTVGVAPGSVGARSGTLTIGTNAATDPSWTLTADAKARELDVAGSVAFGDTPVGSTNTTDLTIRNTGDLPLAVDLSAGTDDSRFALVGAPSTLTVPTHGARTVAVAFTPTATGAVAGNLTLGTNDAGGADGVDERTATVSLSGTGTTSALSVVGGSTVSFGTIAEENTATRTVRVRNTGGAPVTGLTATRGGQNASQFAVGTVPTSLAPGATATVSLTYDPTAVGDHRARVTFRGASGTTTAAVLTGSTAPPDVALNRTAVDFGYVATAGGTSTATVLVSNTDTHGTSLSVGSVSRSGADPGAFSVTTRPTAAIRSGSPGRVVVTFDPTANREQTATLTIATNDPDEATRTVALSGTGTAPKATLSRSTLAFGDVVYGETATRQVRLTNDGGVALHVSSVSPTGTDAGDVAVTGGRTGVTLVPGASETYTVAVTPSTQDPLSAGVAFQTDANDPTLAVSANPIEPEASASPADGSTIDFGDTRTGSAASQTVTVTNGGDAVLRLGAPTVSGADAADFGVVNAPATAYLGPGESLAYALTFAPDATGNASATLTFGSVSDPDVDSISFDLTGRGVAADARFASPSVGFGQVGVGATGSRSLTLRNLGGAPFTVTDVSVVGTDASAFSVSGLSAGDAVGAGASRAFSVDVSPTARRGLSATLEVETDAGDTVRSALGATGVGPDVDLATTSVDFGETRLGNTTDRTIRVNNTGNAPLSVSGLTLSGAAGQFEVLTDPLVVPPKGSREVEVRFAPGTNETDVSLAHQATARTATLTVASNDTDTVEQSVDVALTGTGVTPALNVSQKGLKYGTVLVGSTTTRTVTVRNDLEGTADLEITGASVDGADASAYAIESGTDPTGTVLAPGESTPVTVVFNPQSTGAKYATLTLRTNDTRQDTVVVFLSNRDTIVTVTYGSVTMSYTSPVDGLQPKVDVYRGLNAPAQLDAFQIATTQDADFSVKLDGRTAAFAHAEDSPGFESIRYIEATTSSSFVPGDFQNATITFRVRKATLASLGATRSNVVLYHYDAGAGAYEALTTTFVRETRTEYVYSAETTAFSEFSVGVTRASLSLSNERASATSVTAGTTVRVLADVTNDGHAAGTQTVTFEVDGSTVSRKSVTVAAGDTETVSFDYAPTTPGSYALSVNGTAAGTLLVQAAPSGGGATGGLRRPTYAPELVSGSVSASIADADPASPGTTLRFASGTGSVREITFEAEGATGQVTVTEFREPPADAVATAPGRLVHAVDVDVPAELKNARARVTLTLPRERLDGQDPSTATVVHRGDDGRWTALETTVVSATEDEVTLRAVTPGFSLFGVVLGEAAPPTGTATATPGGTATGTPPGTTAGPTATPGGGTPGGPPATTTVREPAGFATTLVFVAGAILLALAIVLVLVRRRRPGGP